MPKRLCLDCGKLAHGTRCEPCRLRVGRRREHVRDRLSARQRGYTTEYEHNRATVLGQDAVCWICRHPGADQADHVTPTSRGGGAALANLRPAHGTNPCATCGRRCNQSRGAKITTSDDYAQ